MSNFKRLGAAWLIPLSLLALIITFVSLTQTPTEVAVADSPPPTVDDFAGDTFVAQLENTKFLNTSPITFTEDGLGWTIVLTETFNTTLDDTLWTSVDNDGVTNNEYYWATGLYTNTGVTDNNVARAIAGGANGVVTPTQGYPDNVDSWLVLGPLDLSNVPDAMLTFDYYHDASFQDYFGVAVSTNGVSYSGLRENGGDGSWSTVNYDLSDYTGNDMVYVAFIATTDASGNTQNRLGAYLNDLYLRVRYEDNVYLPIIRQDLTPIPVATNTPTPAPTPVQVDNYVDDFIDDIDGWDMRRTDDLNSYEITHRTDDAGLENMQIRIDEADDYMIASPDIAGPNVPFNIEVVAKMFETNDQDAYSIIFSADKLGEPCPRDDFGTCFTQYYQLRFRWRDNGNGTPYFEYVLRKIINHDEDGGRNFFEPQPWARVNNINANAWVEWDVLVQADGRITLSVNDEPIATIQDTELTYITFFHHFGVEVISKDSTSARVKFDSVKVQSASQFHVEEINRQVQELGLETIVIDNTVEPTVVED